MTGEIVPLFHPRRQDWADHFSFDGPRVVGETASGWATIRVLAINSPDRVRLRRTILDESEG